MLHKHTSLSFSPQRTSHHREQGNRRTSALWDSESISSQKCARTESSFHVENICLADRTSMATWKCKLRTVLDLPFFNRIICKVPVGDNTKSLQAVIQTMLPKSLTTKTNKDIEIRLLVMISGIRKYRLVKISGKSIHLKYAIRFLRWKFGVYLCIQNGSTLIQLIFQSSPNFNKLAFLSQKFRYHLI